MNYHVIASLLTGLAGGVVRGLVGITKKQTLQSDAFKMQWKYFWFTLIVSALVGMMTGVLVDNDWKTSLLAGYAGTDLLENMFKVKFSQYFPK